MGYENGIAANIRKMSLLLLKVIFKGVVERQVERN